jgi:hypothetical protein
VEGGEWRREERGERRAERREERGERREERGEEREGEEKGKGGKEEEEDNTSADVLKEGIVVVEDSFGQGKRSVYKIFRTTETNYEKFTPEKHQPNFRKQNHKTNFDQHPST